jgi:glyoxylase-like metal-dependent hydrolase (beta-lactamase superfamily II)
MAAKVFENNSIEIYKLTERVYFRYADWNHRQQCNGGYIVFKDFAAVVDAPSVEGAKEMLAEARQLFGKPVKYVFLTHGHWDHADGLPVFAEQNAVVIASANMLKKLASDGVELPELSFGVEGAARIVIDDMVFEPFTLTGAVHSNEDLFIAIPSEDVVFTGDAVAELTNLYFGNSDFDNWLAALDILEGKGFGTVCVGHGRVKDGSHFAVQRAYFNALKDAANTGIGKIKFAGNVEPEDFADAAAADAGNFGAKGAIEMAGEEIAKRHIAALYINRRA